MSFDVQGENRVRPVSLGRVNIYFIRTQSGYILVDTGMPGMRKKLDAAFEQAGIDPKSVQLILLTHGHLDHIGCTAYAKRITGAKVACHQSFAGRLAKGEMEPAVSKSFVGRLISFLGGLVGSILEGIQPDILIEDELDLGKYGIAGKVIHTPGHSPSSVSILLDSGETLVGDMIRPVGPDKFGIGRWYEDKAALLESLERVAALEPRVIYLSHGESTDLITLRSVIETERGV